jgi:hypothetical protein
MEEGSVGEAKEEEESGELVFCDESGGEEDWDDGTDESGGMNGRRNRLVGSWIDIRRLLCQQIDCCVIVVGCKVLKTITNQNNLHLNCSTSTHPPTSDQPHPQAR